MKRIIASAGLVALGVASSQAASTPGLVPAEQSKPWNISLAVRGFYDDNYTTQTDDLKRDSYGVSVNPTAAVNFNLERTVINFNYNYDMRWYEDRSSNEADHIQVATLDITHAFTERVSGNLSDRVISAQEGSVYLGDGPVTTLQSDADYFRNTAKAGVGFGVSERFGIAFNYANDIWDYEQQGTNSRSALLDRMEQLLTLEGSLSVSPTTKGVLGYQLGLVDHGSDAQYLTYTTALVPVLADASTRDVLSHYGYLGIEHSFSPKLFGALRGGVQFNDYRNADELPTGVEVDDSTITPYINGLLTYTYNPGSTLTLGVVNTYNQTDFGAALSQESVNVYLKLNHRVTPKWTVGGIGMFQHSSFTGGVYDGDTELFYIAGVNTSYQFGPNLSGEMGYNYDRVDSDIDSRSFDRNRVFLGLRAAF